MRPFWRYYGGKWRATKSGAYPQPLYPVIVEPFAGAAGYSTWWGADRECVLVEKYPTIASIWRWLIRVDPAVVLAIPEVDDVRDLPHDLDPAAYSLVGFTMNSSASTPRRSLSRGRRMLRAKRRQFEGWTDATRRRVAEQVTHIRRWRMTEGDYTEAPDIEATWFIDPPYQIAGRHYVHGPSKINYAELADWCRTRRGQVIVCEQDGATWLPFRRLMAPRPRMRTSTSVEATWP